MGLINMSALRAGLRAGERLVGIDPGAKRVGVALSDVGLMLATPAGAMPRGKLAGVAGHLRALAEREGVGGMVVGLPLSMDGSFGPAAQAARDWALALSGAVGLPAAMWDERLSTAAVERALAAAEVSRGKRAAVVDGMAAAWTLQAALDATRECAAR